MIETFVTRIASEDGDFDRKAVIIMMQRRKGGNDTSTSQVSDLDIYIRIYSAPV